MRLPPLNALRAFEAAARHLSFAEAAAELHVTPAAISHQIKALEEWLGQQLFERKTRQVRLTEAGQALRQRAAAVSDQFAQTCAISAEQAGALREQLVQLGQRLRDSSAA